MNAKQKRSQAKTLKALQIIERYGGSIRPKAFAHEMWPDSPAWEKSRACGRNGYMYKGMGLFVSAGCYLGGLAKKGLLEKNEVKKYEITEAGKEFIETHLVSSLPDGVTIEESAIPEGGEDVGVSTEEIIQTLMAEDEEGFEGKISDNDIFEDRQVYFPLDTEKREIYGDTND